MINMIFMYLLDPSHCGKLKQNIPRADPELQERIMLGLKMVYLPRPK